MSGITVTMALVDCIPVVLFFIAAIRLQHDLYPYLVKGAYSLLAAGSIMAFLGGLFKALWKLLYALNICDYVLLDHALFVLQGPGFLLFFLGLTGLYWKPARKGETVLYSAAPVVVASSLPFLVMQVVGLGGAQVLLGLAGAKKGRKSVPALFALSFVFMLGMGYLGAKFDDSSRMHWVAQLTNILSMTAFLLGTVQLRKAGYQNLNQQKKEAFLV